MNRLKIGPLVLPIMAVGITAGLVWGPLGSFIVFVLWLFLVWIGQT